MSEGRILLVSNRLPVTSKRVGETIELTLSAGGLATALRSFSAKSDTLWFGWPGAVHRKERAEIAQRLLKEFQCVPVFLSDKLTEKFYEGFSNRTLWPILHSFPTYTKYSVAEWDAYKEANARFSEVVSAEVRPGDMVWVHDYQLMLLPRFLRERFPALSIGFFLHIPFPPYEILRLLPQHREIAGSLLAADLIGFHTHDYAQAFLGAARRLFGYDNALGQLVVGTRIVQVDVFPIGIDFAAFSEALQEPGAKSQLQTVRETVGNGKIVFSVSRLDYTKGILQGLEAIETVFERSSEWRGKIVYVLVVVPSRENVERYASLKKEIDEEIGRINSRYGTLEWTPIRYIYRNLTPDELVALYAASDVALVTPLRDGMNLIAKEYIATHDDSRGVLVLSDMAGAAKELGEALIVNPNAREEVADAIQRALSMPEEEQRRRNTAMRERLRTFDVHWWVRAFVQRQEDVRRQLQQLSVKILDKTAEERLLSDYRSALGDRLMIFDYDGTLIPFAAFPGLARPDAELLEQLRLLTAPAENNVVILSSRDKTTMDEWLGNLNITLAAEHGAWVRWRGGRDWQMTVPGTQEPWKKLIRPMLDLYVNRIPGSFVEEKDFSLVWHYRQADRESGWEAARELLDTLTSVAANLRIQVIPSSKAVEVKTMEMSKGMFYARFLAEPPAGFILAAGDDWKDEDLFAVLPPTAYSLRVGLSASSARFNVHSVNDVRHIINLLKGTNNVHAG